MKGGSSWWLKANVYSVKGLGHNARALVRPPPVATGSSTFCSKFEYIVSILPF